MVEESVKRKWLVMSRKGPWEGYRRQVKIVYHLHAIHGQTGRSTVWANGTQNSGLVNFVPESRLPFVQISSIYQKTTAKAWTRFQRWLWRNGTQISVWNIPSGKTGLPFQMLVNSKQRVTLLDGMAEYTENSKIRNIRNILKLGIYRIF